MDFSIFYRLRMKKVWWVDVIFYFAISLLVSTVLCYLIFILKIYLQSKQIRDLDAAMETVGTDAQKEQEKTVFSYQKKINDYALLIQGHEFSSNVFAFVEKNTQPNVWFSKFGLSTKQNGIDLSGEAENMDALSRQTAIFEKSEFVKKVNLLGSSVADLGRVNFNLSLTLDPKIFNYVPPPPSETPAPAGNNSVSENPNGQPAKSSEKLITSFDLPLNPEVTGAIDNTKYTIVLAVPPETNLTSLAPRINLSPKATIQPAPDTPQNFSSPVTYTVTAEDGSTQNYQVTVAAAAPASAETPKSKTGPIIFTIVLLGVIIAAGLGIFFFLKKRSKGKKQLNVVQNGN